MAPAALGQVLTLFIQRTWGRVVAACKHPWPGRIDVWRLLPNDFYDRPLFPLSIELGIEDSLPRSEIEFALGDRQGYRLVQKQTLEVRVPVILTSLMVAIVFAKGRELLQPLVDVLNQPGFVVVHVDSGGDVHRRDERQPLFHSALPHGCFHLRSDVDVVSMLLRIEFQVLSMTLHETSIAALSLTITACVI